MNTLRVKKNLTEYREEQNNTVYKSNSCFILTCKFSKRYHFEKTVISFASIKTIPSQTISSNPYLL